MMMMRIHVHIHGVLCDDEMTLVVCKGAARKKRIPFYTARSYHAVSHAAIRMLAPSAVSA